MKYGIFHYFGDFLPHILFILYCFYFEAWKYTVLKSNPALFRVFFMKFMLYSGTWKGTVNHSYNPLHVSLWKCYWRSSVYDEQIIMCLISLGLFLATHWQCQLHKLIHYYLAKHLPKRNPKECTMFIGMQLVLIVASNPHFPQFC